MKNNKDSKSNDSNSSNNNKSFVKSKRKICIIQYVYTS